MSKISELVLNDENVRKHDFTIVLMATSCAIASLLTKTFLTFSGGSDAIYVMAAGYFAIGGNLFLLSPKIIKSPIQKLAGMISSFAGEKSNFAFILKTLGALGFMIAGFVEGQQGLAIGGAGYLFGNIIALIKGHKIYSIAGYGMAAGAFLTAGLGEENNLLLYAGVFAILETVFLAIYKNHDESRAQVMKDVWEEKRAEIATNEAQKEELEKIRTRRKKERFSNAFMSNIYDREGDRLGKYFESEFAKYAAIEKQVIDEVEES